MGIQYAEKVVLATAWPQQPDEGHARACQPFERVTVELEIVMHHECGIGHASGSGRTIRTSGKGQVLAPTGSRFFNMRAPAQMVQQG
ncbi:hypothetical protein D3C75_1134040 [compost metagenome]